MYILKEVYVCLWKGGGVLEARRHRWVYSLI